MGADPFDILGLAATFDLDPGVLHRAWLGASARLHPDRAGADEAGAIAELARVNRAKSALSSPLSRGEALLTRLGGATGSADRSLPDGFLAEMLDVREELEGAASAGDRESVARWRSWAEQRRAAHVNSLGAMFKKAEGPGRVEALRDIRRELNAWRYIERMIEQLPD